MRILLIGASGFLGGVLWRYLRSRHEIVGTCYHGTQPDLISLDVRDKNSLSKLVNQSFDLILYTAGLISIETCEDNPQLAWSLNVEPLQVLKRISNTKIIYFSSDNVFSGEKDDYLESSQPSPINMYGWSKLAGESVLDNKHLIIRLPFLFGRSPRADKFLLRFRGPVTPVQENLWFNPIYLPDVALNLERLWHFTGIVHLGGPDVISRYAFFHLVQQYLDLPTQIQCISQMAGSRLRRPRHPILRSNRHTFVSRSVIDALIDLRGT